MFMQTPAGPHAHCGLSFLDPHPLSAIVDDGILEQPVLLQRAPGNVFKPIIAADNHGHSIQEDRVAIPHGRALPENNFVIVCLEDGFVVVNAIA